MAAIIDSSTTLNQGENVIAHFSVKGFRLHVEQDGPRWSLWVRNEAAQLKWLAAEPSVDGCVIHDMGFTAQFLNDRHYPSLWRQAVRAKFLAVITERHAIRPPLAREDLMPHISTLGTFTMNDHTFAVEIHTDNLGGEAVAVTSGDKTMTRMALGTGKVLGPAAPADGGGDAGWLDALRERASQVLVAASKAGRGPWAHLDPGRHNI